MNAGISRIYQITWQNSLGQITKHEDMFNRQEIADPEQEGIQVGKVFYYLNIKIM